ncbi:MAG: arginine--tRNA ligase [bacterium]|nr:arginine--tRNA ligase [bacterium]
MKPLPRQHAVLVEQAIRAAQDAGDLPAFDLPEIEIKPPKKADQGDYYSPIAMVLAKTLGAKPLDLAQTIAKHIPQADFVGKVEVAPPGFLNFRLSDDWLRGQVEAIIEAGDDAFTLDFGTGKRAQVEFVSANPTGPLHIGRSRGAIVGDTMARILQAAGFTVEREYYFNNAGVQMVNLGNSLRIRYLMELHYPVQLPDEKDTTFYQGGYLIDFARELVAEHGDALVEVDWQPFKEYAEKKMFEMVKATLERVDIRHDVFFNENSLYESGAVWKTLEALDARGTIYEAVAAEGEDDDEPQYNQKRKAPVGELKPAKWFRSTDFGDSRDRVMVKGDGNPTYTLPDIAYHMNKLERGFDVLVNILGADHYVQHQVVKHGVRALGGDVDKMNVVIIQLVRMIRGGQEVKMSTRRGDYDTLDDLIDQTSADAVRYILLARNANSHLDFDLDLAVKQSNENPVYYIQYAHVRCAGILREAAARSVSDEGADLSLLSEEEVRYIRKMLELAEQIERASIEFAPHTIAFYALELANLFHPMYDRVRVFGEGVPPEVAKARLRFYRAVQITLRRALRLMGMSTPERM